MAEAAAKTAAAPGKSQDFIRSYNWKVRIVGSNQGNAGLTDALFIKCSGLEICVDTVSYCEGGDPREHKFPGRVRYPPITLEKGLTWPNDLWSWMQTVVSQRPARKDVSILMLDSDGITDKLRWNLHGCWPCRWRAQPLDAGSSLIAIHSLELAYEYLDQDAT